MEHLLQSVDFGQNRLGRAERVAESLSALHGTGERPEELAHDARNLLTALELYCDLLEERGVLSDGFGHYAGELRLVAAASRRLLEKLSAFDMTAAPRKALPYSASPDAGRRVEARPSSLNEPLPEPIECLAEELEAKRNLMIALAGPGVEFRLHLRGGALPACLTREDLTRILVNLVKNAVEAMPNGGCVELSLDEFHSAGGGAPWLVLKVEDTGPGIPATALEAIFLAGYTTRAHSESKSRFSGRRGLGLSITRAIIEAAGGRIYATNRPQGGARFEIELPARMSGISGAGFPERRALPTH